MLTTNNISAILASQLDLSLPSLTSTLKSEDSKEVVSHDHGPGSCELKEAVDKLRIAMERLGRWGSYGADRKHEAFHGAATTHCHTHTHHHLAEHCPPHLSGLLPVFSDDRLGLGYGHKTPNLTGEEGATAGLLGGAGAQFSFSPLATKFPRSKKPKGKDGALKESRMRVAMSPHNTKLKPWVRVANYRIPTSSDEEEQALFVKKKAAPMKRSVKLSQPLTPKLKDGEEELNELVDTGKEVRDEDSGHGKKDGKKKVKKGRRGSKRFEEE